MPGSTRLSPQLRNWIAAGGCALAVLACIVVINPRIEMGVRDDWSYIYTTMLLAKTGKIVYNGWASPTLGIQLYLGALFVRLFGDSFTAIRASSMLVGVLTAPLMYALLVRARVRTWNAILGTLTLVLSPLFLPLAVCYMSDSFTLLLLLAFFYAGLRCCTAATDRSAVLWLAAAAVAGTAAGTIRQIACLSLFVALPCILYQQRKRRGVLAWGIPLCVTGAALVLSVIHWFGHQPYAAVEPLLNLSFTLFTLRHESGFVIRGAVSFALLLSPVLLGIALRFQGPNPKQRTYAIASVAVIAILVLAVTVLRGGDVWGSLLVGDYVTTAGIIWQPEVIGPRPVAISPLFQAVFAFCMIAIVAFSAATIWAQRGTSPDTINKPLNTSLAWIFLPFAAVYLGLVYSRSGSFDRYYLPLLPIATVLALRWYEDHYNQRLSWTCVAPLALLAAFAVAGTHDQFAALRARLDAANELRSAGIPRNQFYAGFEYDAWTQLEASGYVNEPRIRTPASAHVWLQLPASLVAQTPSDAYPWRQYNHKIDQNCFAWFRPYIPSIRARYQFQGASGYCFPDTPDFAPVHYKTWLAPRERAIYIAAMPERFR